MDANLEDKSDLDFLTMEPEVEHTAAESVRLRRLSVRSLRRSMYAALLIATALAGIVDEAIGFHARQAVEKAVKSPRPRSRRVTRQ